MKNKFIKKECKNCKHCYKTTIIDMVAYSYNCNKNNDMLNCTVCNDFEKKGEKGGRMKKSKNN